MFCFSFCQSLHSFGEILFWLFVLVYDASFTGLEDALAQMPMDINYCREVSKSPWLWEGSWTASS
jgi:hypothetical protein